MPAAVRAKNVARAAAAEARAAEEAAASTASTAAAALARQRLDTMAHQRLALCLASGAVLGVVVVVGLRRFTRRLRQSSEGAASQPDEAAPAEMAPSTATEEVTPETPDDQLREELTTLRREHYMLVAEVALLKQMVQSQTAAPASSTSTPALPKVATPRLSSPLRVRPVRSSSPPSSTEASWMPQRTSPRKMPWESARAVGR